LALSAPAIAAAALSGRGAVAPWQPAAARSEGSGRVRITSKRVVGLYPGARKRLILTLRNRDTRHSVRIRRIRVDDVGTTRRGCAPSQRNLRIRQYRGRMLTVPPRGRRRVVVRLTMPYTVANACQRATFKLRYSAQTTVKRRRR
jgi:hypothetical protein